MRFIISW